MDQNVAGYELAANRLLNRGRKMSNADSEQREQAELLIAAANVYALLDLASAIRGNQPGSVAVTDDAGDDEDTVEGDAARVAG